MAALLRAAGVEATFYTGGEPGSDDVTISRELAARFGLAHEVQTPSEPDRDWTAAASRLVRQTDGLTSLVQLVDSVDLDALAPEVGMTLWGVGGEIGRAGSGALSNVSPNLPSCRGCRPPSGGCWPRRSTTAAC